MKSIGSPVACALAPTREDVPATRRIEARTKLVMPAVRAQRLMSSLPAIECQGMPHSWRQVQSPVRTDRSASRAERGHPQGHGRIPPRRSDTTRARELRHDQEQLNGSWTEEWVPF